MTWIDRFFSTADLTPHGFCLLWRPDLLWMQVLPDGFIALSYYSIPIALAAFVSRRRDVAFGWIFWMFAAFILACGTTHVVEILTLWYPAYAAQGLVKVVTAAISVATAILLWPLLPRALALPSPAALRDVNAALASEVEARNRLVIALQREMAERQRVEDSLRQSQKMEGLGQLTGGVAHDFNNLLTIIEGNLHLLKDRGAVAGQAQIAAIERAVARGGSLTRHLLAFARRQPVQPRRLDLAQELPRLADLLGRSLPEDIHPRLTVAPHVWPVEVDPGEFELALVNLASNARDAMPEGGTLSIVADNRALDGAAPGLAELVGDFVCISVTDTGRGIPPELIERVFEPFFTTKDVGKGTGLGLAQVYGFSRQAGGLAVASSVMGRGTTVALYLPRARGEPEAARLVADGADVA